MFTADSRYAAQPILDHAIPAGEPVRYVAPRLLPQPDSFAVGLRHRVADSDRVDLLAWKHLGAPTLSWRIADANRAMNPFDLAGTPGQVLVIPLAGTGAVTG